MDEIVEFFGSLLGGLLGGAAAGARVRRVAAEKPDRNAIIQGLAQKLAGDFASVGYNVIEFAKKLDAEKLLDRNDPIYPTTVLALQAMATNVGQSNPAVFPEVLQSLAEAARNLAAPEPEPVHELGDNVVEFRARG